MEPRRRPVVYTAQSKQYFYCRDAVCEFVFSQGCIPVNPFRLFDYFLGDRVDRDKIRAANAEMITRSDQVWVFGETLADGVLAEIAQAVSEEKPVRYFNIDNAASRIAELDVGSLDFEQEVRASTGMSAEELRTRMRSGKASELVSALRRPIRVTA